MRDLIAWLKSQGRDEDIGHMQAYLGVVRRQGVISVIGPVGCITMTQISVNFPSS